MRFQFSIIIIGFMLCVIATQSTSKYEGVSWNKKRNLWQAEFCINGQKRKRYFNNEFDAAQELNQLCDKSVIPSQNPQNCEIPNQKKEEKESQYKGVYWHKQSGKWYALICLKGQKQKYGGSFKDELDAAKRINQLCKEFGIASQNPTISAIPNQREKKEKTSQYKGVTWHKKMGKWYVRIYLKGQKSKYDGYFKDELDAAKRGNQLCEELKIPLLNPEISSKPKQKKERQSKYRGVFWHRERKKWYCQLRLKGRKPQCGGCFNDELEAGKRINQLCEELGIPLWNPEISAIPNQQYQKKEKTSQYKGVYWHGERKKWCVQLRLKGGKPIYGGNFENEINAAKRVNQLCEKYGISLQNPEISAIPNQEPQEKQKTSQYKGVSWNIQMRVWVVRIRPKGQTLKYGGCFEDEVDAAKGANQLCQEMGIPLQNPEINAKPNQQYQKKEKTSQYKGVCWHRDSGRWQVQLLLQGKLKYGGYFEDELDAAKRVNQLCEGLGIPLRNPEISATPNQQFQKKQKTSQYKGVTWHRKTKKWYAQLSLKQGQQKCGGYFENELSAAKKLNQLCEELEIPLLNPEISAVPNQQCETNCKTLIDCDAVLQAEFQELIKILDENNDLTTQAIKQNLIAAINYREQTTMPEINLRTKNGESTLSIAAKHGFSNVVKFLISKGAEKDHFTNDHHTPLSSAVSQNHLKVVQVLFEDWMSPNSHEKPYLYLSPIFQVKSREIAQLLIDNDAVTHDIYNDKNQSPLSVACQNGYLDVVEFFLDDGLNINHLDCDNKTPLFYALTNKHEDVAKLLISKGAKKIFTPPN